MPIDRALPARVVRRSMVVATLAVMASTAVAAAAVLGPLSTASRPSPFATCTDGTSVGPPPGEVFVNAEVEPWVAVNPTEGMERTELRQRIDKALGQLSYEHRTVLILHEFEDLEYKEIAKRMECSIGTVMSRLFYARRKMANLMASYKREELS